MFNYLLVACAFTSLTSAFTFPDAIPLEKRQQPGTPQYECHENCGGVITSARTENFCDSANFTSSLDACLNCAEEFNIWQYYGESVSAAAQACGLDASPVAANATTADATNATTADAPSSTTTESASSGTATAANGDTSTPATSTTTGASGAAGTASEEAASPTSESAPAATPTNSSPQRQKPAILLFGAAAIAALCV